MRIGVRLLLFVIVVLTVTGAAPPPPAVYDVEIRYKIDGFGVQRIAQYYDMTRFFRSLGFKRLGNPSAKEEELIEDEEREDPRNPPLRGMIASANARKLLAERHVQIVKLMPEGAKSPDKDALVRVQLELQGNLGRVQQQQLSGQVRRVLNEIGFKEAAVYDHRDYTRLVGAIPYGQIDVILNDLRKYPKAADEPAPFASVQPIRVVEVMPDVPAPAPRSPPPPLAPELTNVGPELRLLLLDKDKAAEPLRFEIVLALAPNADDRAWMAPIRAVAPSVAVEGRIGPIVTAYGPRGQALAIAALPDIAAVRLPRPPRPFLAADKLPEPAPLYVVGKSSFKVSGELPPNYPVAIVDPDFRGWEALREKYPAARFRFIDLTRERNPELKVEPYTFTTPGPGRGTQMADALLRVTPNADLALICVDPAAPYQLETVARAVAGLPLTSSLCLETRLAELNRRREELDRKSAELLEERARVFGDFRQEEDAEKNRQTYRKHQADHNCDDAAYTLARSRFLELTRDLAGLKGIRLVLTGLVWDDGHPVSVMGPLVRSFDENVFLGALWFHFTGTTPGQEWKGLFHDRDNNEVMEFAPPDVRPARGRYTNELDFLEWRGRDGKVVADLPEKATIRVSLQWNEAHEAVLLRIGEDAYRSPLADLRLQLVRQTDPDGKKQPDDEMEIVAESVGPAQRILNTGNSSVYEQTVTVTVPAAGRYAVRVLGRAPNDTRPPGVPSVPSAKRGFELKPRLFVTTVEGDGRAVFTEPGK
jgi:hypothetical protein